MDVYTTGAHGAQFGRIDSLRLADKLGGSVEDDHRAKSIGLEPTTYGVSRFGCYQLTYLETLVAVLLGH